jgi:hypothetical protein
LVGITNKFNRIVDAFEGITKESFGEFWLIVKLFGFLKGKD